jgi:integrase
MGLRSRGAGRTYFQCLHGPLDADRHANQRRHRDAKSTRPLYCGKNVWHATRCENNCGLDDLPPRIDTPLLFPSPTGRHLNLGNWHRREWLPALEASGVGHGTIYTLRHTFATNALAAGLSIFELGRSMGTSVEMIDRTYGHLAQGSEQAGRAKLDALGGSGV